MMLGVYDYTVVLTYISLMISIGGMMFSFNGHLHLAVLCLALSGLCDMFDGKIARTKKNRTEVEKRFGIQIDSLSYCLFWSISGSTLLFNGYVQSNRNCYSDVLCTGRTDSSGLVQCIGRSQTE